jgi:hypothetical protein
VFLEIDEHFHMHRKSVDLCARLMNPVAWAYVQKLWAWACGNAKDGDLTDCTPGAIEFIVGWHLADGKFYDACVAVGFIDEDRDDAGKVTARRIHNWMKRTGAAIARMQAAAEASKKRKKDWRERNKRQKGTRDGTPGGRDEDGTELLTDGTDSVPEREKNADGTHQDKSSQGKASQDKAKQDQGGLDPAPLAKSSHWSALEWLRKFGIAWARQYQTASYGRGDSDAKAIRDLDDLLATLTEGERIEAQTNASQIIGRYLADKAAAQAKHPFKWFAERFNGLRIPPAAARRDPVIATAVAASGGRPYLPPKEATGGAR